MKKALFLTSKIIFWLLALLGAYALIIFVALKIYQDHHISTFGMIVVPKEIYLNLENDSMKVIDIRKQRLKQALETCKQQNLFLRKFDSRDFSFECDTPAIKNNNISNSNITQHQNKALETCKKQGLSVSKFESNGEKFTFKCNESNTNDYFDIPTLKD